MGQVTNGVDLIEVGTPGTGGAMSTSLAALGLTNIDSASIGEEDPTTTDFNVEERDTPLFSRSIPGKTTLSFQVADPVLTTFTSVFGGTITGSGASAVWNAPTTRPDVYASVKITPKVGYIIQIPYGKLTARFNAPLGKNNLMTIDITVEVLTPEDGITAPIMVGGTVSSAGGSGTAQTITFASLGTKSIATDSPLTLTGTSSSGLPLTYLSDDPTKATVNGNVVTLLTTGSVNIIALQPGNGTYAAATPEVNAMTITA